MMFLRSHRLLLGLIFLIVLVGLLAYSTDRKPDSSAPVSMVRDARTAATSQSMPLARRATDSTPPLVPATSPERDDLCGVPAALQLRQQDETLAQHVERATRPNVERWRQALADSDSPRLQAIALALADATPGPGLLPYDAPSSDAHNQLVLRAQEGSDPAIYSLALGQCGAFIGPMPPGSCQGLSFEKWARMDSSNAIPWLWLAVRSAADPVKLAEVLQKAAEASRFDSYLDSLISEPMALLPPGHSDLDQIVAGTDLLTIARLGEPPFSNNVCSAEVVTQPDRRAVCEAIARRYASESKSFLGAFAAAQMGRQLGWPEEQVSSLETEAATGFNAAAWGSEEGRYQCSSVASRARYFSLLQGSGGSERAAVTQLKGTVSHP
jgi:hypothetical protein